MYAVASLLNPAADKQTRDLWSLLEKSCGLSGISMTPLPHFSWLAADECDAISATEMLSKIYLRKLSPFTTRTAGLGIIYRRKPCFIPGDCKE